MLPIEPTIMVLVRSWYWPWSWSWWTLLVCQLVPLHLSWMWSGLLHDPRTSSRLQEVLEDSIKTSSGPLKDYFRTLSGLLLQEPITASSGPLQDFFVTSAGLIKTFFRSSSGSLSSRSHWMQHLLHQSEFFSPSCFVYVRSLLFLAYI